MQLLRQLRAAATECGVESVPDNASRVRVRAMADAVLASTEAAHAGPQKQVRKLLKQYESTFEDTGGGRQALKDTARRDGVLVQAAAAAAEAMLWSVNLLE